MAWRKQCYETHLAVKDCPQGDAEHPPGYLPQSFAGQMAVYRPSHTHFSSEMGEKAGLVAHSANHVVVRE